MLAFFGVRNYILGNGYDLNVPGGGATVASRQRGVNSFNGTDAPKTTMNHTLTFVCGENPDTLLQRVSLIRSDSTQLSGQWDHLVQRTNGRPFEQPPENLVLSDGKIVTQAEVGEDGIRARLLELEPSERVTILTVVN